VSFSVVLIEAGVQAQTEALQVGHDDTVVRRTILRTVPARHGAPVLVASFSLLSAAAISA